jgi:hypothetical protein
MSKEAALDAQLKISQPVSALGRTKYLASTLIRYSLGTVSLRLRRTMTKTAAPAPTYAAR